MVYIGMGCYEYREFVVLYDGDITVVGTYGNMRRNYKIFLHLLLEYVNYFVHLYS